MKKSIALLALMCVLLLDGTTRCIAYDYNYNVNVNDYYEINVQNLFGVNFDNPECYVVYGCSDPTKGDIYSTNPSSTPINYSTGYGDISYEGTSVSKIYFKSTLSGESEFSVFIHDYQGVFSNTTKTVHFTISGGSNTAPTSSTNTGMTVVKGATAVITSSMLAYTDAEQSASALTYTVSASPTHGMLEKSTNAGVSITTFTQSEINGGTIRYVNNGLTSNSDAFTFSVSDGAGGTSSSASFSITVNSPPTATTDAATSVTSTAATLNGTINANSESTTVTFEYGSTIIYGTSVTADQSLVTGSSSTSVSKAITGLSPNTTYHYRVIGVSTGGTTNGDDLTFATSAIAPTATTGAASSVTSTGATLNGTINANNGSTVVTFEYGLTTGYGTTVTASQSPVAGSSLTAVSYAITGLTPGTTYHYRVIGVNTGGTTNGLDQTFTTTCTDPATAGSVSGSQAVCGEYNPTEILSIGLPSGQAGTLEYKWQYSTTSAVSNFSDIDNSNSTTYDPPSIITQTTWYRRLARVSCSADWSGARATAAVEKTVYSLPVPTITGNITVNEGSVGNTYTTETGMSGYSWSVSAGGSITAGSGTNQIAVTWNTPGTQTVSVNYIDLNSCSASTATVKNVTVKALNVNLSRFYTALTSGWDITSFNDLATAISNSATGSTITIKKQVGEGYTVASINTTNNTFIIDDGDLVLTSTTAPIVGTGLIQAIGDGYLVMSPQSATALTYPVTDGTHDYSVTVTSPTTPTNPVKVRIHDGANANRALTIDLWDIQGDAALDATIKFKIPKASITSRYLPSNTLIRRKVGVNFVVVPRENVTIGEFGDYYEVTIIHVNQF